MIGFSTGALALGDFRKALVLMAGKNLPAVELSALRVAELPDLIDAIPFLGLREFRYVAVHAPSSFDVDQEIEIVGLLRQIRPEWKIILHPDTIHNPECWRVFGDQLLLENMDRRKPDGRSAEELARWFEKLPSAQLCFDLAHAQQLDTTMTESYVILKRFGERLGQIHISQLDSSSHHRPLSVGSVRAYSEISWLFPPDVPFIIESRVSPEEMDREVQRVEEVLSSDESSVPHSIPA